MLCADIPPRIYESLKTLCCLATASGPRQAREIASAADLPPAQTAKILQFMTWAGFVDSRRGTKGGFWLIRRADKIRVTDVADFFSHLHPHDKATKSNGLRKALEEAMTRCRKAFQTITIADLAKVCECDRVGTHGTTQGFSRMSHRKPTHKH
jgi:Rrf2 family protein